MNAPGKVYLIGAGPGDIELLTLKAARALANCDIALIDDLVNREVLQFAKDGVEIINVGKRGHKNGAPQSWINELMIFRAQAGQIVGRIKGGDPYIFGRGAEELEALREASIEVEVINGITSGIAVPAALGIPLTHRDHAQSVTFVTGHNGGELQPNWRALAQAGGTLVIYMGLSKIRQISSALVAGGLSPQTPAVAIQSGTLPEQRAAFATVSGLADAVKATEIGSPAIIVIGELVGLAEAYRHSVNPVLRNATVGRLHAKSGGKIQARSTPRANLHGGQQE